MIRINVQEEVEEGYEKRNARRLSRGEKTGERDKKGEITRERKLQIKRVFRKRKTEGHKN